MYELVPLVLEEPRVCDETRSRAGGLSFTEFEAGRTSRSREPEIRATACAACCVVASRRGLLHTFSSCPTLPIFLSSYLVPHTRPYTRLEPNHVVDATTSHVHSGISLSRIDSCYPGPDPRAPRPSKDRYCMWFRSVDPRFQIPG